MSSSSSSVAEQEDHSAVEPTSIHDEAEAKRNREASASYVANATENQSALWLSELSYRRLFEAARDGILIVNLENGQIEDVNPYLMELLGFQRDEMIGKTVAELSPFRDLEPNDAMLERLQKEGYVRYEDLPLETQDGRRIAVEFVSNVYPAGDRRVIQCNIRDITERKRSGLATARLAALVESSGYAIIGKDLQHRVTSWNRGAEKIFGYTAEEMVGQSIMRLIPPEAQGEAEAAMKKVCLGENVERSDSLFIARGGRLIPVSIALAPIKDPAGRVIGVSKVLHDIFSQIVAEEKIRQLNLDLESRVAERTAQLEAANRELEAFSYSVSHDLRAPLRHVLGFVKLLENEAGPTLSETSQRYLTNIARAGTRMGKLIDDLIHFARIGQGGLSKKKIDLHDMIQEVVEDQTPELAGRQVAWSIQPIPVVNADPGLIRQVLTNLIANAIKFTGHRPVAEIEIGATVGKGETVIFVRDNGVGFEPKYSHKLFGVFQRLHTQEEFPGTGIGLANVQRIVHRHGGRVWAEGAIDGGATIFFSLPDPEP